MLNSSSTRDGSGGAGGRRTPRPLPDAAFTAEVQPMMRIGFSEVHLQPASRDDGLRLSPVTHETQSNDVPPDNDVRTGVRVHCTGAQSMPRRHVNCSTHQESNKHLTFGGDVRWIDARRQRRNLPILECKKKTRKIGFSSRRVYRRHVLLTAGNA